MIAHQCLVDVKESLRESMMYLIIQPTTGKIIHATKAACNFYQYTYEELTAMSIQDINVLDVSDVKLEMKKAMMVDRNYFNFNHVLKNGEVREVGVICTPMMINGSAYLCSQINDLASNPSKIMLADSFYESKHAIVVIDNNRKVVAANKSFSNTFLYEFEEIMDHRLEDLITPEELQNEIKSNLEQVYNGEVIQMDTVRQTKFHQHLKVHVYAVPFVHREDIIGVEIKYTPMEE